MTVNARSTAGHKFVGIKIGREINRIKNATLAQNILKAYDHYVSIKTDNEDFSALKKYLGTEAAKHLEGLDTDTITFLVDDVECRASFRVSRSISPDNIERMKKLLKSRFEDLVEVKESYRPTKKLLEMAEEDEEIAELIEQKPAPPAFRFQLADPGD